MSEPEDIERPEGRPLRLECFPSEPGIRVPEIHPAPARRDWMDATEDGHAYRCLPLTIANQHGWEVLCPTDFEAEWTGGPDPGDVILHGLDDPGAALAHFGHGILTFNLHCILRTAPGINLWVTGPINDFKDGIQGLSALIETDWMPFTFTMNWKFTRPGHRVRFEAGTPICHLCPMPRGLVEQTEPVIRDIASDPDLQRQFATAKLRRTAPRIQQARSQTDERSKEFQRWYIRGETPDGSAQFPEHQKSLDVKSFRREE